MGVRVAQDFPEAFAAEINILGVTEGDYPRTRRDQRAKVYDKWVKWRENMENASKQAYAILRLAVENSSLEVIKTRDGYEEANNNRDAIAFLNVLNQAIYSGDIPVNDRIIGIKAAKEMFELARRQKNGKYAERIEYLSTLKWYNRAVKSHGVDPLCTFTEVKEEIRQTVETFWMQPITISMMLHKSCLTSRTGRRPGANKTSPALPYSMPATTTSCIQCWNMRYTIMI